MPFSHILLWQCHLAVISRNSLANKSGNTTNQMNNFLFSILKNNWSENIILIHIVYSLLYPPWINANLFFFFWSLLNWYIKPKPFFCILSLYVTTVFISWMSSHKKMAEEVLIFHGVITMFKLMCFFVENISPILLAHTVMIWICTRLQRVIAAENSTACLQGSRIQKARWCEQRNSPAGECKSNDGPMNQVYPHSIHEPIADHQRPEDISCKPRI